MASSGAGTQGGLLQRLQHPAFTAVWLSMVLVAQDPRIEHLPCTHAGTYADDCLCERVQQHKCYIVATCDRDLRRRIRKVRSPGFPHCQNGFLPDPISAQLVNHAGAPIKLSAEHSLCLAAGPSQKMCTGVMQLQRQWRWLPAQLPCLRLLSC